MKRTFYEKSELRNHTEKEKDDYHIWPIGMSL